MKRLSNLDEAFIEFLDEYPLAMFLGIYAFIFFLFCGMLFIYHTFLIFTNQTTNEQMKEMWKLKSGNPFQKWVNKFSSKKLNFFKISSFINNVLFCCFFKKKNKFFKFDQEVNPESLKYNQATIERLSIEGTKSENLDPNELSEKNELNLIELKILNTEPMTLMSKENISFRNIPLK